MAGIILFWHSLALEKQNKKPSNFGDAKGNFLPQLSHEESNKDCMFVRATKLPPQVVNANISAQKTLSDTRHATSVV